MTIGDNADAIARPARLASFLPASILSVSLANRSTRPLIGVLEGAGIGPEVISATLHVLQSVEQAMHLRFEVRQGGLVGEGLRRPAANGCPRTLRSFARMCSEPAAPF